MALTLSPVFRCGFDHYELADITQKWNSGSGNAMVTGLSNASGQALQQPANLILTIPSPDESGRVGFYFEPESIGQLEALVVFSTDASSESVAVNMTASGALSVRYGGLAGTTTTSTNTTFQVGQVYYLEVAVYTHNTNGAIRIDVDGLNDSDVTLTSVDTLGISGADIGDIEFNSDAIIIDDVHVEIGTGTSIGSGDMLGPLVVRTLYPQSDGTHTDFSLSAGSDHYALVDEAQANEDTDYIHTSTASDRDSFNFDLSDLGTVDTIQDIQLVTSIRKEDPGTARTANQFSITTGPTTTDESSFAVGDNYVFERNIRETNPGSAAAWTTSDSLEVGVRLVS